MATPLPAFNTNTTFTPDNLLNVVDTTSNLVNQYVVSPLVNLGVAGFVFDISDETRLDLTADITDHYAEDNSAIQDHIAIRPDRITLRGYVGELVYRTEKPAGTAQKLTEKIATINSYVPVLTAATRQVQNAITGQKTGTTDYFKAGLASAENLYAAFKTLNPPKTKQAQALNFFRALFNARQLVSLETPWTFYSSMAIESISVIQPADTKDVSDFSITLKKIRTADVKFVAFDPKKYQGRTLGQASEVEDKGRANGKKVSTSDSESILFKLREALF